MPPHRAPFRPTALALALLAALAPAGHAASPGVVLPAGTLPVFDRVASGQASVTAAQNLLTIQQATHRAILDWRSFNIGAGAEVRFVQPNAGASALNRIFDQDPSIIQGRLTANGQVYLVNQNGILFDKGSQINVGGLLASTLRLPDEVYLGGLAVQGGTPALVNDWASGTAGNIDLLGAIRTAPGGSVMVFAPRINNRGTIATPDGQIIMAAGDRVWLANNDPTDFSMRGLLVEFQAGTGPVDLSSTITNTGTLSADRGNVSLAALAVNQAGTASASTAVLQNGSVWLLATERGNTRRGEVNLGRGSFTGTPLDATDTTTLADDQNYAPYRAVVRIEGKTIVNQGQVVAPGGVISVIAQDPDGNGGSRIYLDNGSLISAAGSWADLAMSKNLVTVQITSNELKDAPLQKGGPLLGSKLVVDIRKGTPLFDDAGFVGQVQRGVAEKSAPGGQISLQSDGDVIVRSGSAVDVSGGGYRFQAGVIETSVLSANGRAYDIGSAAPDIAYDGVLNTFQFKQPRAPTQSFGQLGSLFARYEAADVQGADAGVMTISAAGGAVLEGNLVGRTTIGRNQLDPGRAPAAATLILGDKTQLGSVETPSFGQAQVRFAPTSMLLPPGFGAQDALPAELRNAATLPLPAFQTGAPGSLGEYRQAGFGNVELYANDSIAVPAGVAIRMPIGGSLLIGARDITVAGDISAPGGSIQLKAFDTGSSSLTTNPSVHVTGGVRLDVSGLFINDSGLAPAGAFTAAGGASVLPRRIDGGSIRVSGVDVRLDAGSVLDASGGARLLRAGSLQRGGGGAISARTGLGNDSEQSQFLGVLQVQSTLLGNGPGGAGALDLHAASLQIGGTGSGDPLQLVLDPGLLEGGEFASFNLAGIGPASLAPGTRVFARSAPLLLDPVRALAAPTGTPIRGIAQAQALDALLPAQRTPARVTLAGAGKESGSLMLAAGASLQVDPRGTIALSASNGLTVLGDVIAPAGSITLRAQLGVAGRFSDQPLRIGDGARLLAPGVVLAVPDALGRRIGDALAGGSIVINAVRTALAIEPGATLDVSGASGVLDLPSLNALSQAYVRQSVNSAAGAIVITATSGALLDGRMLGAAGSGAPGGSFALDLLRNADIAGDVPRRLVLSQSTLSGRDPVAGFVDGYVAADTLADGGFDSVRLRSHDLIEFRSDLLLAAPRRLTLDAAALDAAGAYAVRLRSTHLTLQASASDPVVPPLSPRAPIPTRDGSATLDAAALNANGRAVLDLVGDLTLNGFSAVRLAARDDLRLSGNLLSLVPDTGVALPDTLRGSLTTTANLTLQAAQIFPTTFSQFSVRVQALADRSAAYQDVPGGSIRILSSGSAPGPALSAAGNVTFAADSIVQGGVVKAPLGQIVMTGTRSVELLDGSTTSVAGDARSVPFGTTRVGQNWYYAGILVASFPEKRVALNGADVQVREGALVDVRGGGGVQAAEFVKGPGGSTDTLLAPGTYAILPWLNGAPAPFDTDAALQSGYVLNGDTIPYDSVTLGAGGPVAAGTYALLPGYYALLPGAYVVRTPAGAGAGPVAPGSVSARADGTPLVAGYWSLGATGQRDPVTRAFAIESQAAARKRSEYTLTTADFFAAKALARDASQPALPVDAGTIAIAASASLQLDGLLRAGSSGGGRSGELQISAAQIAVVAGDGSAPPGYLQLDAGRLSASGARLLLGGTRDAGSGLLQVIATDVLVDNGGAAGVPLTATEITLAASNSVTVRDGSTLRGTGTYTGDAAPLQVSDNGAILRVAAGAQRAVVRSNATPQAGGPGALTIGSRASVQGDGAVLVDATGDTSLNGTILVGPGGSLSVGARLISVGQVTPAEQPSSMVLSNAQLAALGGPEGLSELVLRSYQSIDFYGAASVGGGNVRSIVLDAPLFNGVAAGTTAGSASVAADAVTLRNTSGLAAGAVNAGPGTFTVSAGDLVLGAGDKALGGFAATVLTAARDARAEGKGTLAVPGTLTLTAGRVVAAPGALQAIAAQQAVTLARSAGAGNAAAAPLGGGWSISGSTITQGANFVLPAGTLALTATQGDVVLADGGSIFAGAAARDFSPTAGSPAVAYAPGGKVELVALNGAVRKQAGATLDVSGTAQGGDAGLVRIAAASPAGTLDVAGAFTATAAPSARGGAIDIDVGTLADAGALIDAVSGGFAERFALRVRQGALTIPAGKSLAARRVALAADAGPLTVDGTLSAASGSGGNRIDLNAGGDLVLASGSLLDARGLGGSAPSAARDGGTVNVATGGKLTFAEGARIDVSTHGGGNPGTVTFTAPRSGTTVAVDLAGAITGSPAAAGGPARVVVVGNAVYAVDGVNAGTVAAGAGNPVWADYNGFVTGVDAGGVFSRLQFTGLDAGQTALRAGVELRGSGDLTVAVPWDLSAPGWNVNGQPGVLTVRTPGSVLVNAALGLPSDALVPGESWSVRLVAGADLAAASPRAVLGADTAANVVLGTATAAVRTGTGYLDVAAARDVVLGNARAVLYTAGQPGFGGGAQNQFPVDGGVLTVSAGRDIAGPGAPVFVNDWLLRSNSTTANLPGFGWWPNRAGVRQAFGALGGGGVELDAGRDVVNAYVVVPSSGRITPAGDSSSSLDVQGAGTVHVRAARDIVGGQFLLGLGQGRVAAGRVVGAQTPTALYVMGQGSSTYANGAVAPVTGSPSGARFDVLAGEGVTLSNVSNPTILALSAADTAIRRGIVTFFSYAPTSGVSVTAVDGDIVLGNKAPTRPSVVRRGQNVPTTLSDIAPPQIALTAFDGSVTSPAQQPQEALVRVYPDAASSVRVYAAGNIGNVAYEVEDVVASTLPQWYQPVFPTGETVPPASTITFGPLVPQRLVTPQAESTAAFQFVAGGDLTDLQLTLPRYARIEAVRDIVNLQADLQNLSATDLTVVRAGRDLRYQDFVQSGLLEAANDGGYLRIGGPGRLMVQTGRDLDLGVTQGIQTVGSNANLALTTGTSAAISVLVGVQGRYEPATLDAFLALTAAVGTAQESGVRANVDRALAAVETTADSLFGKGQPGDRGNLTMYFSSIRTEGGSGIDLILPRGTAGSTLAGNINAGLPSPAVGDIGVVTVLGGGIRAYLENSFNVNQSKVVTLQGGDILILARDGNIDAGRGARDSRTTQPPRRVPITVKDPVTGQEVDTGLFAYVPPLDASGSGIRTFTSDPDGPGPLKAPKPGNVTLIAPRGFVDAGEAGVASAGNVVLFANTVLNAQNISSSGASVGVPVSNPAAAGAALSSAGSSAAGASRVGDDAGRAAAQDSRLAGAKFIPSFITVEVIGLGEEGDESGRALKK
jgi:filamentous hemagglutinin family protein